MREVSKKGNEAEKDDQIDIESLRLDENLKSRVKKELKKLVLDLASSDSDTVTSSESSDSEDESYSKKDRKKKGKKERKKVKSIKNQESMLRLQIRLNTLSGGLMRICNMNM